MTKSIELADLKLLLHFLVPKSYTVMINKNSIGQHLYYTGLYNPNISKVFVNLPGSSSLFPEDNDYFLDFNSSNRKVLGYKSEQFNYINNNDKTIRWIYPSKLKVPTFLNLFNSPTLKAKLLTILIKLSFRLKISNLIKSGSFTFYYRDKIEFEKRIVGLDYDNYSIFTGTPGPNRKLLVEVNKNGKTTRFIKLAINDQSKELIKNEVKTLRSIAALEPEIIKVPQITNTDSHDIAIIENIFQDNSIKSDSLTEQHFPALHELYRKSMSNEILETSEFWNKLTHNIDSFEDDSRLNNSLNISYNLKKLRDSIDTIHKIPVGIAHMDFTPWNMYLNNQYLCVYDWELSEKKIPLLFDLFHFIFQSEILAKHSRFEKIKEQIHHVINHPKVKQIISDFSIDVDLHYKLYLLNNISYYMKIYSEQTNLHMQVAWLTNIWNESLEDVSPDEEDITHRKAFVKKFFQKLRFTKYALLKNNENDVYELSEQSDLDILIDKKDKKK